MLSTNALPDTSAGPADYHGSMGSDGTMSKDATGYPNNQRAMLYMLLAE